MTSIALLDTPRETLALPSTAGLDLLDDEQLLARQREFAAARRVVDSGAARVAAEIERRSRRELGHRGLAQRRGAGAAPRLVERLAGVSPGEASTLVAVGGMLEDVAQGASPWLRGVATAVDEGAISVAAARVIGDGLGAPSASVDAETLADLARRLVAAADDMTLRGLAAEARTLRDGVDQWASTSGRSSGGSADSCVSPLSTTA